MVYATDVWISTQSHHAPEIIVAVVVDAPRTTPFCASMTLATQSFPLLQYLAQCHSANSLSQPAQGRHIPAWAGVVTTTLAPAPPLDQVHVHPPVLHRERHHRDPGTAPPLAPLPVTPPHPLITWSAPPPLQQVEIGVQHHLTPRGKWLIMTLIVRATND